MKEFEISTIRDLLFNSGQTPDHNAIESPKCQPLTYRDLRIQVLSAVKALSSMGFGRNDRIAIVTPAGPETAVVILSVMTGFTSVPMNPQNKEQEYARYFSELKIKAVIAAGGYQTDATVVAKDQNVPVIELSPLPGKSGQFELSRPLPVQNDTIASVFPSDIALILQTSGTTDRPKIVPISQKQLCRRAQLISKAFQYTSADRCLHIVPYYHAQGLMGTLIAPILTGGSIICTRDFIPSDFPGLLITFQPTYYWAGPALHQGILREITKLPINALRNNSLRFIKSGSVPLPTIVHNEMENLLGIPMIDGIAMSEAGIITVNIPPKQGSVGSPVIEFLEIINENGNVLKPNMTGEITVKGEGLFSGYENAPEENKAAFIDGWFRTGDMGYLDDDGYLFLTGRKKDLINKGGEKISPMEIDAVLRSHPGVREGMAFMVHDPVLGEDISAMVVPADETVTEKELRMYVLDRLVQFKVPKRIYLVDAIPRNPAGKPLRHVGTDTYSQLS